MPWRYAESGRRERWRCDEKSFRRCILWYDDAGMLPVSHRSWQRLDRMSELTTAAGRLPLFGAIEAGGTKFVCAVGESTGRLLMETRIATRDPQTTFAEVFEFFRAAEVRFGSLRAFGVGAFGPLDIDPASARYGYLRKTPKAGWSDFDLRGMLVREFGRPVGFNTDVNAAGLAEYRWGRGAGLQSLVYVTVGTGIGAAIVYQGAPLVGATHSEIGHIYPRRHPLDRDFAGVCPFHGDCLEGLASGPAIHARIGSSSIELPAGDPLWDIEADYLGQLCAQLVATVAPHRILLGGGVMQQKHLFALARQRMQHWLGSYSQMPQLLDDGFIDSPGLGGQAGVTGALALAIDMVRDFEGAPHNNVGHIRDGSVT